jgi:hypothetical protein
LISRFRVRQKITSVSRFALLGVFASTAWNPAANGGVNGLLAGDSSFS